MATVLQAFWTMALGDINNDGYLDRTFTFVTEDTADLVLDSLDGDFICLHGVTLDGVRYEDCTPLE